jgi:hypothetical protein
MGFSSLAAFGAGGMLAVVVAGFVGMVVLAAVAVVLVAVPVVSLLAVASRFAGAQALNETIAATAIICLITTVSSFAI